ncbi:flagellin lysine-N-methylase [Anaerosporobacter sp.]|uniref:flagellin lysine-N-methylase n=1 Tax=Anaerosporobacter sp. TaxID=1872529 RepID=UPI00286F2054|nr:flagellin lysine-N-methylase [Anaerosporobacter sp.]
MLYSVPDYYNQFSCIADQCEDTCCAGWEIMIDAKTLQKYKEVEGGFGNCLQNSIQFRRGSFKQYNHRCAFLNEDNFCDIYTELGASMLCDTCRKYPRHMEEYDGVRDLSLSLSCPEVARIILSHKERVRFLTKEKKKESEQFEDFDFLLYTKISDARNCIIGTLQNRKLDVNVRAAISFALAHDLQNRINSQEYYTMDRQINRYKTETVVDYMIHKLELYQSKEAERFKIIRKQFSLLFRLEVLRKEWSENAKLAFEQLYKNGWREYIKKRRRFLSYMRKNEELGISYETILEQLYVYFTYTYFSGAVYDENAYGKMKLAVISPLIIQELCQARWQENRSLTFADIVDIAHKYSREIEHSDINLKKMERLFGKKKEFYFEKVLISLLS